MTRSRSADAASDVGDMRCPGVELPLCAVAFQGQAVPGMSMPGFFKISFVRAGSVKVRGPFGARDGQAGDVIVLGPRIVDTQVHSTGHETTVVYLHSEFVADVRYGQYRDSAGSVFELCDAHRTDVFTVGTATMARIGPTLDALVTATNSGAGSENSAEALSLAARALGIVPDDSDECLRSLQITPPVARRPVRPEAVLAANLLRSRFDHQWTLNELAGAVNLSRAQLSRVFVAALGRTPQEYLTQVRIQRMALLLRETTLPVTAICSQVGWKDRSHAAAIFARHKHRSPERYRADPT